MPTSEENGSQVEVQEEDKERKLSSSSALEELMKTFLYLFSIFVVNVVSNPLCRPIGGRLLESLLAAEWNDIDGITLSILVSQNTWACYVKL